MTFANSGRTDLIGLLREQAEARRMALNEKLAKEESQALSLGDYQATWRGFAYSGKGNVLYKGRNYQATILGRTSIPMNGNVKLTVTKSNYYVDW